MAMLLDCQAIGESRRP